ncbi:MAG: hypothetical protein SLAVMIC_00263 [uncultured marine phage]|uniref:Uncharacterized protein n=1 Tax=uncultured marine phage TaxID=707152 RepID=A0A8D9C8M2_9VIRU|nr:MAG: hypothetical protein SLAVMIC_00263 [uncultured marine phage]
MRDILFKLSQILFILTVIAGFLSIYFIESVPIGISVISSLVLVTIILATLYIESKGTGFYLLKPPKKIYTVDGEYYIKLMKYEDKYANDYDFNAFVCKRWFVFWVKLYMKKKIQIVYNKDQEDNFNRAIGEIIKGYKKDVQKKKKRSYYSNGIFKDLNEWDGLVGDESDKKILLRGKRLNKILGNKEEKKSEENA